MENRATTGWWARSRVIGSVVTIVLGFLLLCRSSPVPPPAGWTIWRKPGVIRAILVAPDGVYAGGIRGLFRVNRDGNSVAVDVPGTRGPLRVESLAMDANGSLWVGHDQGVSIRKNSAWQTLGEADGLPEGGVTAICFTKSSFAWLGTKRGAARVPVDGPWDRANLRLVTAADGLLNDDVRVIAEDPDGGLWFGSDAAPAGGITRLEAGRFWHWTSRQGIPHPTITSLLVTNGGDVWAGCGMFDQGGAAIFRASQGTWKLAATLPVAELAGPKVRSLYQDRHGRIWIGSEYDGLTIRQGDRTVRVVGTRDGLPAGEVAAIAEGEDGAMWLGTSAAVVRILPPAVDKLLGPSQQAMPQDTLPAAQQP